VTFADTIDMQFPPASTESAAQKKALERAVAELLGSPVNYMQDYSEEEKRFFNRHRELINNDKSEILNSQPDVIEFITQTDRMQLYYGMMGDEHFLETDYGKALTMIIETHGDEYPMVYPSTYDGICESVAKKTNTQKMYIKILKGRA
jgi:hypothetical protein